MWRRWLTGAAYRCFPSHRGGGGVGGGDLFWILCLLSCGPSLIHFSRVIQTRCLSDTDPRGRKGLEQRRGVGALLSLNRWAKEHRGPPPPPPHTQPEVGEIKGDSWAALFKCGSEGLGRCGERDRRRRTRHQATPELYRYGSPSVDTILISFNHDF